MMQEVGEPPMKLFSRNRHRLTLALVALPLGLPIMEATRAASFVTNSPMILGREYETATLLSDGRVLVAGQNGSLSVSNAELRDLIAGTWSATGPMSITRRWHTTTLLPNGKVLVAGGFTSANAMLSSAEMFDPAAGVWTNTSSMSTNCYFHTATLLLNGKVLVTGGSEFQWISNHHRVV